MSITREYIEELKSRINIVDYISNYTDLKPMGNVYVGVCPNPSHQDSDPSFRVWPDTNSWACMGCHSGPKGGSNYGTDIIAFVQWIEGKSFIEAVEILSSEAGMTMPTYQDQFYLDNFNIATKYHMKVPLIEEYLSKRGLDRPTIRKFKIGFDGDNIIIPLIDRHNRYVGFTKRRFISSHGPKYVNSKNSDKFQKNKYFYNLRSLDKDLNEIRIVEGPFDVMVADRYGAKNVVSTLGTALTDEHVNIIESLGKTPVICFDGDEAGFNGAIRASKKFEAKGIYSKIIFLDNDKDIADIGLELKEGIEDFLLEESISYNQFRINNILNKYDAKVNEYTVKILPEVKDILSNIKNENEKNVLKGKIEKKLGLNIF